MAASHNRRWCAAATAYCSRVDIGLAPSAGRTSAPTLYVFDCLGGVEAFYRQCRFMVTGPVAFTLAQQ